MLDQQDIIRQNKEKKMNLDLKFTHLIQKVAENGSEIKCKCKNMKPLEKKLNLETHIGENLRSKTKQIVPRLENKSRIHKRKNWLKKNFCSMKDLYKRRKRQAVDKKNIRKLHI